MSENPKPKKPHSWFFKNFIGGVIFSYVVWAAFLITLGQKEHSSVVMAAFAIIPGVLGALGYVLVKLWDAWLYSHFVFFTRINPITLLLFRYIIYPAIGCILAPCAIFALVLRLMGKL